MGLKDHYCVHKIPPPVRILSHIYPLYAVPPYFPKIHSNIIIPSTPRSSDWSLLFRFVDHNHQSQDGGRKVLRNIGILQQHYTASQPRTICDDYASVALSLDRRF